MNLTAHDKKAYQEAEILKEEIVGTLEKLIKNLESDLEERNTWLLRGEHSELPNFSRTITTKKAQTFMKAEEGIIKKKQNKTLTNATKNLLEALDEKTDLEVEKTRRQMTKDFKIDLREPPYTEMDEEELGGVYEEFSERLEKELNRIRIRARKEKQEIISNQPTIKKAIEVKEKAPIVSKELKKLRSAQSEKYAKLEEELVEYQENERRIFENEIAENEGLSKKDIIRARKDNEEQIEKEKTRRYNEFNSTAELEVRMVNAKSVKLNEKEEIQCDELMEIYFRKVEKTIMFPKRKMEWEEMIVIIDIFYSDNTKNPNWNNFVEQACKTWSNIGSGTDRKLMDRQMSIYAKLFVKEGSREFDSQDDKDRQILKLKNRRDELVMDILSSDRKVTEKIKEGKIKKDIPKKPKMEIKAREFERPIAIPKTESSSNKKNAFQERCLKIMEEEIKNSKKNF